MAKSTRLPVFIGYFILNYNENIGLFPAMLIAMVICAGLGMLIEFLAYVLCAKQRGFPLTTRRLGCYLLQNIMTGFFNPMPGLSSRDCPEKYRFRLQVSNIQLIILFVSLASMVFLQLVIQKTKMGKAARAVSVDSDAAQLMGINVNRTISFTFALGSAPAAAGDVNRPVLQLHHPMMG